MRFCDALYRRLAFMLSAIFLICLPPLFAAAEELPLEDDLTRGDLSEYAMSAILGDRSFPRNFTFPKDVRADGVFGIDVSHHNGTVNWNGIESNGVLFVYAKATQGANYYDKQFDANWNALAALRSSGKEVYAGAYHFLSAGATGRDQANNFLNRAGRISDRDLPPCLDLEWDFEVRNGQVVTDANGNPVDRWATKTPDQIVKVALEWLSAVENAGKKKPIIYTNSSWWKERIGNSLSLKDYVIWISDYSRASLKRESPSIMSHHQWSIWQLTDRGSLASVGGLFDANQYKGGRDDFIKEFSLK